MWVCGLSTCCGEQLVAPTGGTIGVGIGATDGGMIWQMVGGQIGGVSIALLQIGCICPFTQRQTHAAGALVVSVERNIAAIKSVRRNIRAHLSDFRISCKPD